MKCLFFYVCINIALLGVSHQAFSSGDKLLSVQLRKSVFVIDRLIQSKGKKALLKGRHITEAEKRRLVVLHVAIFNERFQTAMSQATALSKRKRRCEAALKRTRTNDLLKQGDIQLSIAEYELIDQNYALRLERLINDFETHVVRGCNMPYEKNRVPLKTIVDQLEIAQEDVNSHKRLDHEPFM